MASSLATATVPTKASTDGTGIPVAPATLDSQNIEQGLRLDAINKKLQMESVLDDIFEDLSDTIESRGTEAISVPDAIFMKLQAVPTGANSVTVPILRPLQAALTVGPGSPMGNEETQRMKYAKFYYDEYSHAVPSLNYGKQKNEMDMYGVWDKIIPQMGNYMREIKGQRIRKATLRTFCDVITETSTASASWNSNWFIPNTEIVNMPSYSNVDATFSSTLATALNASSTNGTDGASCEIGVDYLDALAYYAPNIAKIDPIMIGGKAMYVVLIPSSQIAKLSKNTPGQLGEIFTQTNRFTDNSMKYTGLIGVYKNLMLVEDQRNAELNVNSSTGALELRFLYPGNNDLRTKAVHAAATRNWDMGALYGAGALCEWEVTKLHFEKEVRDYNRRVGNGMFGESGISLVKYDVDAGDQTGSTIMNHGSIILPFATPSFKS